MIVTKMSLAEYFDLIGERATFNGFKWIIMFIGRKAEAENIYNEIEGYWSSLHDLTNDRIAFVFSSCVNTKNNSFYRLPNRESYIGRMCPFARVVGEDKFQDNIGDFEFYYDRFKQYDWKEVHTQSITEFIRKNEIEEYELPGLFIYNVFSKDKMFVHLKDKASLYSFLKDFVYKTDKMDSDIEQAYQTLKNNRNKRFFDLEEEILKFAEKQESKYKNAVVMVLNGSRDYKSCKEIITDKQIRKQVKTYGQWKRQLAITNDNYLLEKENYYKDKRKYEDCINKISIFMTSNNMDDMTETSSDKDEGVVMANNVFVFIVDDWGFSKGGINVFNRLLCEAMGALKYVKVICVAQNITAEKEVNAKIKGVELLNVSCLDFENANAIVSLLKKKIDTEISKLVFIGHDVKTGDIALKCKAHLPDSKCAIIHHMAYAEYYPILNKDSDASEAKEDLQRKILQQADVVFANGVGLEKSAQDIVGQKVPVIRIFPGVADVEPRESINNSFRVVTFGRVEQGAGLKKNNSIIKEIYLALAAWADFTKKYCQNDESTMKIYGKNVDDNSVDEEMDELLKEHADKVYAISTVKYEEDRDLLLSKLSEFSLCLVLSLREGFGLTALEAISAGVPLIVSKSSGFYKSLEMLRLDSYVYGVDIQGKRDYPYYSKTDLDNVSKTIYNVFKNQRDAKDKAIELRKKLEKEGFTWKTCATSIIKQFVNGSIDMSISNIDNKIVLKEIMQSFNRPVFTSDFHIENSLVEIQEALRDTNSIINTGYEKSSGIKLHKYSVADLDEKLKKQFSEIVGGINLLRKILSEAEKKQIIHRHGDILLTEDILFCGLMNDLRIAVIFYVRRIALENGLDFPDFELDYSHSWDKVEAVARGNLQDTMLERLNVYARESNMWNAL